MKIKELLITHKNLELVADVEGEMTFAYAIAKNRKLIAKEVEVLEEISKPSKEYTKYDDARVALAVKYAKLDDDGRPSIKDKGYVIDKDKRSQFEEEFNKLKEDNAEVIKAYEDKVEKYNEYLDSESTFKYYTIAQSKLPKLTPKQYEAIFDLIVED